MIFDACARYRKVKEIAEDGRASFAQLVFIERHEADCPKCVNEFQATQQALSFLKSNIIEPEHSDEFESMVLKKWRVERRSRSVSYWLPAVAGAVVAGAAFLAVLQILVASPETRNAETKGREALLNSTKVQIPQIPEIRQK